MAERISKDFKNNINHLVEKWEMNLGKDIFSIDRITKEYLNLYKAMLGLLGDKLRPSTNQRKELLELLDKEIEHSIAEFCNVIGKRQEAQILTLVHDMRNPLAAVKLYSQLICRTSCGHSKHEFYAHKIDANIDRLDSMVQELLDAALLRTANKNSSKRDKCHLLTLVENVVQEFTVIHGQRFEIKGRGDIVGFWCSKGIRRVLENLLSNALKYGFRGELIRIGIAKSKDRAIIKVNNKGPVISRKEIPHLFNLYHRAEDAEKCRGWGIGLNCVQKIIEAHQGKISVSSSARYGTTFCILLPLHSLNHLPAYGPD